VAATKIDPLTIVESSLAEAEEIILSRDYWKGSVFENLATRGTPDDSGKWGEKIAWLFINALTHLNAKWDGDNNTNAEDGTYDISFELNGKKVRIEVKTSRLGVSVSWQHENIIKEKDKWDKLILVDYEYSTIWFTILDYSDMHFKTKHPIFGITPCLRDNETSKSRTDKYKWDFRPLQIERGVAAGLTFCYDLSEPDHEAFSEFLIEKLKK
jgi:hypothetical protein